MSRGVVILACVPGRPGGQEEVLCEGVFRLLHSLGEREVICMLGWQGAPGPAGCQMQKRLSDRMAIGARPTAGAGDGSALLPQAPL